MHLIKFIFVRRERSCRERGGRRAKLNPSVAEPGSGLGGVGQDNLSSGPQREWGQAGTHFVEPDPRSQQQQDVQLV